MPELPEVETVRKVLEKLIIGLRIINVQVIYEKMLVNVSKREFENLVDQTFLSVERRGKYLIFNLDDYIIISHLRMEGKFYLEEDVKLVKHEHIKFYLSKGLVLRYIDVRKFGRMYLYKKNVDIYKCEPLKNLGKEIEEIDFDYLKTKLNVKLKIKTFLLNQTIILGLGNIYANEVLFDSKINPFKNSCELTNLEIERLIISIKKILERAIILGGSTIKSFSSSKRITGLFQNELKVHMKEKCSECGSFIRKRRINGRTTYYCRKCQNGPMVIGLSGSIATGKTYVSNIISNFGYEVIDCDEISKEAFEKYSTAIYKIFNSLDRKYIAKIIFDDFEKRKQLNKVIHSYVYTKINKLILFSSEKVLFVSVPLLFEVNWVDIFDKIVVVYCRRDIQLQRLIERDNISSEYASKIIKTQIDIEEKKFMGDYVIDTSDNVKKQVKDLLERLKCQ